MNTLLTTTAVALAVGFGSAWTIQNWRNLDAENHRITLAREQEREISRLEQARSLQVLTAQNDARKRESQLRADASTAKSAVDSLRSALHGVVQAARADPGVCPDTAATTAELFADSVEAYRELAEICDRHVSDLKTAVTILEAVR